MKLFWWVADVVISAIMIALGLAFGCLLLTTLLFLVTLVRVLAGVK